MSHTPLRFYVGQTLPPQATPPCFHLQPDNWDDYRYQTRFRLFLHLPQERPIHIGYLKILPRGLAEDEHGRHRSESHLPPLFDALPADRFCSLGVSSTYYSELHRVPEYASWPTITGESIARALADLCFADSGERWWEGEPGFMTSLLRFTQAQIARREARSLIRGEIPEGHEHNSLLISDVAIGSVEPEGYELCFDGTLRVPGRLNVIVGRNGSGKTTLLERMASVLSTEYSSKSRERTPPKFSKVAFVSNNVFDEGQAPRRSKAVRFIGPKPGDLQKLRHVVTRISQATDANWAAVRDAVFPTAADVLAMLPDTHDQLEDDLVFLSSVPDWSSFTGRIFEDESLCGRLVNDPRSAISEMSAGQKALAGILAGLFRDLDQQSLVLLDEPENYLHPSLVARFVRALNVLLTERKAFAVVATHSPIVVQETPSRFVTIIERSDSTIHLQRPTFETFGESVENIDEYLFETDFGSSHWKQVLSGFAKEALTDKQILSVLSSRELPLLAQTYLERQRIKLKS